MSVAIRVIPCLDVHDGRVVKGVNFQGLKDAGDPVELAARYDAQGADEITFLDVSASHEGRATMLDVVSRTAEQVFVPLTVGGGVRSVNDVDQLLRAGADKVGINTAAITRPELLAEVAQRFGNQVVVLSVDARRCPLGVSTPSGYEVTIHGGRTSTGIDAVTWAVRGAQLGAGEILLNSMDADGVTEGFDTEMLDAVREQVRVPLIASGGAGAPEDFAIAADHGADAVLAAADLVEAAEAEAVAAWLAQLARSGVAWPQMAVLYRINAQSPALELALAERGIPYQVRNAENFYDRPEVRQALAALAAAARTEGELEAVPRIRAVVSALGWSSEAPQAGGRVRERWESQNALVESAIEIAGRLGHDVSLAGIVAELERRASLEQPPSVSGVTLSTLHSARGLEWEAVGLYGAHEGSIPFVLATSVEQVAEERRLLYVGITRARRHLRISWARSRHGGGGTRSVSRFLESLAGEGPSRQHQPRSRRAQKKTLARVCRVCQEGLTSPAERVLGRHQDCPASYCEPLLAALKQWRTQIATAARLPAYCVFTDATLTAIAEAEPRTSADLAQVAGVGPAKLSKYAADVLALVAAGTESDEP